MNSIKTSNQFNDFLPVKNLMVNTTTITTINVKNANIIQAVTIIFISLLNLMYKDTTFHNKCQAINSQTHNIS